MAKRQRVRDPELSQRIRALVLQDNPWMASAQPRRLFTCAICGDARCRNDEVTPCRDTETFRRPDGTTVTLRPGQYACVQCHIDDEDAREAR